MSLLDELAKEKVWREFFDYKKEKAHLSKNEEAELINYINSKSYLPLANKILSGGFYFEPPTKKLVNKLGTNKKRVVYFFKPEENLILKLLSFLLYKYDACFSPNCFSFRKDTGVKRAVNSLIRIKNINEFCCYKLDIKNYFNSVDIDLLLPQLKIILKDDSRLFEFFHGMLTQNRCVFSEQIITESRGVMAGTPTSPFLSNVFLTSLDRYFFDMNIPYARYSDDIIIFAPAAAELKAHREYIHNFLKEYSLSVNTGKERILNPNEPWSFLGIQYEGGEIDLSPASLQKIKDKIRRKARSIYRWKNKKNASAEKALCVMTRRFNKKFFDSAGTNDLTWSKWFFPLLTTDNGLKKIDAYMQDWLRYLITGKHNKSNFKKAPYELLKACGYVSLVNAYYTYLKEIRK